MSFNTELVGSTVETMVLKLLSERTMYGYEIIRLVNERTEGAFNWKEGTLYPVLHRLEGQGYLCTEWRLGESGRKRKYYRLSDRGMAYAAKKCAEWRVFSRAVDAVLCRISPVEA